MTEEAKAAIAGAREAGATEFVVADSHGSMQNLLMERLPEGRPVVRGSPRPLGMMEGIDATFAGVMFIGYHSGTTNPQGVRAHTISSANLADAAQRGRGVRGGLEHGAGRAFRRAGAGGFGRRGGREGGAGACPGVEGAVVKWPYGFHAARTLSPEASRDVNPRRRRRGMARRAQIPARPKTPVEVEIRFKSYRPSEY